MLEFKKMLSNLAAAAAEEKFSGCGLDSETVFEMLEYPPDTTMGDVALPCFKLSRTLRKAPPMIAKELCEDFKSGKYEKIGIVYTKYVSMMVQTPETEWILPIQKSDKKSKADIIYEPDEKTILEMVIEEYIAGKLVAKAKESFTCEVVARRFAMDNAGKNAGEMIDSLKLQYNRARQGAITQEITEIVAGSGM